MKSRRALFGGIALALVSPVVVLTGPAATAATATGRVYVTDPVQNVVDVFDAATYALIATIPVPDGPIEATASPDGGTVYVGASHAVSVVATATNTVVATIPVGELVTGITFSPNGTRAYAAGQNAGIVSVIDTATRTVIATVPSGLNPTDVAVSPDGSKAYVTNYGSNSVSVINTATNTVVGTVPVGTSPYGVTFAAGGARAYVANLGANTVSVINVATNTVMSTIPVAPEPRAVVASPDGSKVYVADGFTVSVISAATNTVVARIDTTTAGLIEIAVSGNRIYGSSMAASFVVIDAPSESTIANIPTAGVDDFSFAWGLAVVPGTTPAPAATPTISGQASPNNLIYAPFTDSATLSGGTGPTGSVTFRQFSDSACLNVVFSSTNPVVGGKATSGVHVITQPGTFYWRATYLGDANNNPAATPCNAPNQTVVVSPFAPPAFTRTITGDTQRSITVSAGESVHIVNARVAGSVTVSPGGALTVTTSQVGGGIVATDPAFLQVCGAQVRGLGTPALHVADATVPFRVGNKPHGCAGNSFQGNVSLVNNSAPWFANNTVTGNVTVNDGGPGPTIVRTNMIYGTLACSGNDPAPLANRPLERNTAGARTGQCVGAF
jgi:YVTN family beta-propeller protein